jgi:hypothetical protein
MNSSLHKGADTAPQGNHMKRSIVVMLIALFSPLAANAADGMLSVKSQFDVETMADRLEKMLAQKGMTIFNRVKEKGVKH